MNFEICREKESRARQLIFVYVNKSTNRSRVAVHIERKRCRLSVAMERGNLRAVRDAVRRRRIIAMADTRNGLYTISNGMCEFGFGFQ